MNRGSLRTSKRAVARARGLRRRWRSCTSSGGGAALADGVDPRPGRPVRRRARLPPERGGAVDHRRRRTRRAPGTLAKLSTLVGTEQVGRVYDGGACDIGYEVSVERRPVWKHGELPLTVQGGQANTCAGPLTRASDTVPRTTQRHDVWLVSTLGLSGNANVPAVYINRGTVDFSTSDIDWQAPICQHFTQAAADSPDKNWITCDNWPTSKGYGNCYVEYDNNGNGNRELIQVTTDGGLTWIPRRPEHQHRTRSRATATRATSRVRRRSSARPAPARPRTRATRTSRSRASTGIGTTLAAATAAGATNIKVTSIAPFFTTTLVGGGGRRRHEHQGRERHSDRSPARRSTSTPARASRAA